MTAGGARAGLIRALILGALLALAPLVLAPVAQAQETVRQVDETGALMPRPGSTPLVEADAPPGPVNGRDATEEDRGTATTLDYAAWDMMAKRAEAAIGDPNVTEISLEHLRAQLVDWREALQGAQSANSARIATLRTQIAALGPAPADGQTEVAELAERRHDLTEQLVTLQAPGIAAEEAYSRADGLIREIDRVLRDRQAAALLTLWPAPINPANWPEAAIGLTDTGVRLWEETADRWANKLARKAFTSNLPVIVALLLVAAGLIGYGRRWVGRMAQRVQEGASVRGQRVWALLLSLGEIVVPVAGVTLLAAALISTEMLGVVGTQIIEALPEITTPVILAAWLAGRVFPRGTTPGPLNLPPERRAEARYNAVLMGVLLGLDDLRFAAMDSQSYSEGTTAVTSFPGLVLSGLLLVRMGQLLRRHADATLRDNEAQAYGTRLLGLLGRGVMGIGMLGPAVAAVGYVQASAALTYPAMLSLGLIGLILILQGLIEDLYALLTKSAGNPGEALIPVLADFALVFLSVPFFALIWGARAADITEIWTRFREGFNLGGTHISPSNFLIFAVIFAIGYTLTRMFQGGLKSSILPRTSLDQGGQNAVVSGIGYGGIFLSGLVAINAAGIDLSGLAIVAGALSVGIGFGLQTVVSNFVSGIILLVERPVSEGDWIEVGTTSGIVKSISVRSTRIQTFDRADVIVPNSDLISGRVTNWTRFNRSGRLVMPVTVPFTADSRRVEKILQEIAEAQPLAILNPPPVVALMGFTGETMNFEIRVILRDVNFQVAVRSEINHQIAARFAAEGIVFTNAHRDFLQRQADAAAAEAELAEAARQHEDAVAALLAPPPEALLRGRAKPDPEPQT